MTPRPTEAVRPSVALFLVFASGYFLSYFLRSTNAVLAPDLQRDVGLGPADLGLMTSAFFLAYAVAQVPVGLALDRFGPRGVGASLLGVGVLGALLFAVGDSLLTLTIARVLLGVGTGSMMLAGLKAFALWWPAARFATVAGAFISGGSLGALLAAEPLARLNAAMGWRATFVVAAVVVLATTALVWWATPAVRHEPHESQDSDGANTKAAPADGIAPRGTGLALASVMLLGAAFTGPTVAFQTLWGGPYLYDGYGLTSASAGRFLLVLSLGVSTGYGLSGAVADRFGLRRVTVTMGVAFAVVQGLLALVEPGATPLALLLPLYALYGVVGGHCVLVLSNARSLLDVTRSGRATGLTNASSIGGVFLVQWGVGLVVESVGGPSGYRLALAGTALLTLASAAAMAWALARVDRTRQ